MNSIIIPCLNERESIKKVIKNAKEFGEVIVVDNGSTDGSYEIAKQKADFCILEKRKGYGNAYKTGFKYAKGDVIIGLDGDGSYDCSDIPRLSTYIKNYNYDFVLGNRFMLMDDNAMNNLNHLGNMLLRYLLKRKGLNYCEVCTGMFAIKRDLLNKLDLKENDFVFSTELLLKTKKFNCLEIPIKFHKRKGQSKLKPFRDGFRHIGYILK